MTNHYHCLVETADRNLSKGMQQLNVLYTQRFNRRRSLSGHLYQGRYKAILIQKENYLLELTRYVVLNPLRADMVKKLEDWPWSSYLATINAVSAPEWLDVDWLLGQFGKQRKQAIRAYARFVMEGKGLPSPLDQTRHQLLLGDDNFIGQYKQNKKPEALREISKAHRRILALSLDEYKQNHSSRNEAMARAYLSGAYSMAEIGEYFDVHYMTVSRAVRKFEGDS